MMGKEWDGGDIAFRPETWALFQELLHPGASAMAYAGSRGWHREAVAIEDAGYILHPSIFLLWCFGSGFPKATRIDTQIDRDAGIGKRVETGSGSTFPNCRHDGFVSGQKQDGRIPEYKYVPEHPLARVWAGHRYGLQALSPSAEPVIMFQRPYEGRPVDCITSTGAGAINIEGCRVPREGGTVTNMKDMSEYHGNKFGMPGAHARITGTVSNPGGWPPHLLLHHNLDCTEELCSEGCPVEGMGRQSGESKSTPRPVVGKRTNGGHEYGFLGDVSSPHEDSGTAARFFPQFGWNHEEFEFFRYQAKASRAEREAGLEALPPRSGAEAVGRKEGSAGLQSPRAGAGRTAAEVRCVHPTVKSIALSRWLATLLLPPPEYAPRRLLVPFAGVGSEMIGAMLAGWEEVVGIEMEEEYCEIGAHRLRFWQEMLDAGQCGDLKALMQSVAKKQATETGMSLFDLLVEE